MKVHQLLEAYEQLMEDQVVHVVKTGPWSVGITQHSVDQANNPRGPKMTMHEFLAAVNKMGTMTAQIEQHDPGEYCWIHDAATNYSFLLQRRSAGGGRRLTLITVFPGFPVNRSDTPTYKMS